MVGDRTPSSDNATAGGEERAAWRKTGEEVVWSPWVVDWLVGRLMTMVDNDDDHGQWKWLVTVIMDKINEDG